MIQYSPKDLTPIFPPEIKPIHSGVYLARAEELVNVLPGSLQLYAYYDVESDMWSTGQFTPEEAFKYKNITFQIKKYWQGLNYNPKP